MRELLTTLCIAAVLPFGSTEGWGADFQKGLDAAVRGDHATALHEWIPLAEQGNAAAQFQLGWMYDNGLGVPENNKEAVKNYKRAAEQGYARAQFNLGMMYATDKVSYKIMSMLMCGGILPHHLRLRTHPKTEISLQNE